MLKTTLIQNSRVMDTPWPVSRVLGDEASVVHNCLNVDAVVTMLTLKLLSPLFWWTHRYVGTV